MATASYETFTNPGTWYMYKERRFMMASLYYSIFTSIFAIYRVFEHV